MQDKKFTICAWFIPENFPETEAILNKAAALCKQHNLLLGEIGLPVDLSSSIVRVVTRNGLSLEASGRNDFNAVNSSSIIVVNNSYLQILGGFNSQVIDFRPTDFSNLQGIALPDFLDSIEAELQRNPPIANPKPTVGLLAYVYSLIAPFIPDLTFIWTSTSARPVVDTSPNVATNSGLDASQRRAQEKMDALER